MHRAGHLSAPLRLLPTLGRHRFLLGQLAWRAFAVRHAGSYLGWLWTPISTLVLFGLYMAVFGLILEIRIGDLGIDPARRPDVGFGLYMITGLVPFLALSDAVVRGARVFRSHVSLVQRVRLPAEVLVLGDMLGALLHHALSLVVVVAICAVRGHLAPVSLVWIALGLTLLALWIVGAGLIASVLGAFLPDVPEVLGLLFQVVFFCAPIVYPLAMVQHGVLRTLIEINPLTQLLGVLRTGLLGAPPPPPAAIAAVLVAGAALVMIGSAALDRWRYSIPDLL
jgi:ABC-type polysaccharide/polyol phosphate export permease